MIKKNIIIKKDTTENWNKAKNFIPKDGEIICYSDNNQYKIGNGISKISDLPFLSNVIYTLNEDILEIKEGGN